MYTEFIQSQGCAYPNALFCAKELKSTDEHFHFFIFNIRILFLMGIIFLFSYTSWLFCFIYI